MPGVIMSSAVCPPYRFNTGQESKSQIPTLQERARERTKKFSGNYKLGLDRASWAA